MTGRVYSLVAVTWIGAFACGANRHDEEGAKGIAVHIFRGRILIQNDELWTSDGTEQSTHRIHPPDTHPIETLTHLTVSEDWLYLLATDSAGQGSVWRTRAPLQSAQLVASPSFPRSLFSINGEIYLTTWSSSGLWQLQDSGDIDYIATSRVGVVRLNDREILIAAINQVFHQTTGETRSLDFIPEQMHSATNFGNRVAFNSGGKAWATDGTEAGTFSLADSVADFVAAGDQVVFRTTQGIYYISDGTTLGTRTLPIQLPTDASASSFSYTNETLFVFEYDSARALFAYRDGETETLLAFTGGPHSHIVVDGLLYFSL